MELFCFIVHLLSNTMSVRNCSPKRFKSSEFAPKNIPQSIQSCSSWRADEELRVLRVTLQFRVAGGAPKMRSVIPARQLLLHYSGSALSPDIHSRRYSGSALAAGTHISRDSELTLVRPTLAS